MGFKTIILLCVTALGLFGCAKTPTWDDAAKLEKEGQFAPAVKTYEEFLKKVPTTTLRSEVMLRLARCEEGLGNYPNAVVRYQSVLDSRAGGDAEIKAYLGLGNLYRDHLNDPVKALDNYERALSLFLNQADIRDAIKTIVDAKLQTANALFTRQEFQDSARMAKAILQTYPSTYLATDAKDKAQFLVDRVERADRLQMADADQMFVAKESALSPEMSIEFPAASAVTGALVSPDGERRALVRKQNGIPYLYLAGKGEKEKFKLVAKSTGVAVPAWSPRSDALVFVRNMGVTQKLERLDPKTGALLGLFFAKNGSLGRLPSFDPTGSKIVFVYAKCLWIINGDGTNKTKLQTEKPVSPLSPLAFSADGTLLKYRTAEAKGEGEERVLTLDAAVTPLLPSAKVIFAPTPLAASMAPTPVAAQETPASTPGTVEPSVTPTLSASNVSTPTAVKPAVKKLKKAVKRVKP